MQRPLSLFAAAMVGSLAASTALAQSVVVPNDRANVAGTSTFLGPLSNAQRTYQLLIDESQLTPVLGMPLVGISFRLGSAATSAYPAADINFTAYDIRLSASVDPSQRSLTFANNVVGPQTLVRSGPLTLPAQAYTVNPAAPHPFGPSINFDTAYVYNGGDLLLEIRHTGFSGTSSSVDAISTATVPYGTGVSAAWTSSYTGTSGSQGNAVVTQFIVPEPGAIALVIGAGTMLVARRRH